MDPLAGQLLLQVFLISINAFFAATEIAVISLNDNRLKRDAAAGDRCAKLLLKIAEAPTQILSTIQVGITLAGFLGSAFAADNFAGRITNYFVNTLKVKSVSAGAINTLSVNLITIVLSYFTLVFGELVPKRIAMKKSRQVARAACGVINIASKFLRPLIWLLTASTNGVLKLFRFGLRRDTFVALAAVAAIIGAAWFAGPSLRGLGNYNLLVFFLFGVGPMVLLGVPLASAFGLATFGYIALATRTPTMVVVGRMDEGMGHLILLAVPLFVFLGLLIEMTGMARAMVGFLASLLGHVRGGLSYVLIGAMYLVSGISGSKAADMAAVAPVLFPEMKARGAKPGDLVALLAATGAQTETIPPSLVLITIGSVTVSYTHLTLPTIYSV